MRFAFLLILFATQGAAQSEGTTRSDPCYCTDREGSRIDLGEQTCLFVDGRSFMAQCQMSLNVPIWRDIGEACVVGERQLDAPASVSPS
ncbi:hypothetical protein AAD018_006935 [Aestuariibius insulae]|uniref:hypothetical protein n=1 Tax=Aestuariibius insulae TaxID=2058287 RepID=UPI00345ECA7B